MSRRTSKMARRVAATMALAGTFALSLVVGAGQPASSAGGGDGNWPKPTMARHIQAVK